MTFMINGATRLYAIIGNPIAQVRSPETFTRDFIKSELNAIMMPMQVLPDQFDQTVKGIMALGNLDGIIATVPYKVRMAAYAQKLGSTAQCIGAVNALRRETDGSWTGDMFDGVGFTMGAKNKGYALQNRYVALFGAGGAGSAIACELAIEGVDAMVIIDPNHERSEALVAALQKSFPSCKTSVATTVPAGVNMIVNASTVGMDVKDGLPGELGKINQDMLIGDVINKDSVTPMIDFALRHGCSYVTGKEMHTGQGQAILDFFAGAGK